MDGDMRVEHISEGVDFGQPLPQEIGVALEVLRMPLFSSHTDAEAELRREAAKTLSAFLRVDGVKVTIGYDFSPEEAGTATVSGKGQPFNAEWVRVDEGRCALFASRDIEPEEIVRARQHPDLRGRLSSGNGNICGSSCAGRARHYIRQGEIIQESA